MKDLHAVTGAFGYSGRRIAQQLLSENKRVITLTNSGNRPNPFGDAVSVHPFHFDSPDLLAQSLRETRVLYNTYWIRFNYRTFGHSEAVRNTKKLFRAARVAGVERIVHVSITNPSEDSRLEYFRGKAELERELHETGIPYSILRPAVLFGGEDILINNIAWALRRLPVFGVFGDGNYRLQPIHVDDFATLAVREGEEKGNRIVEAIGPETFSYRNLIETLGNTLGIKRMTISVSPGLGYLVGKMLGWLVKDVVITREEIEGLMDELLYVNAPPAGTIKLSSWARDNRETLGRKYASELARRRNI
jgi:NADH dehydrogenase